MIYGMGPMELVMILLPILLGRVVPWVLFIVLVVLAIRWFLRQEKADKSPETVAARRSLGEVLRERREGCKMTQELVAEKLGVSRQAVSKWEQGKTEPSTTNLVKLAHLYGVDPADLLREVDDTA